MTRGRTPVPWLAVLCTVGIAASAQAAPGLSLRSLEVSPDASGLVTLPFAEVLPHGVVGFGYGVDLQVQPLRLSVPDLGLPTAAIVRERLATRLAMAVGLFDVAQVSLRLGLVAYQGGLDTAFARETVGYASLGEPRFEDMAVAARAWVVRQDGLIPAIAAGASVTFPTGDASAFVGEPGVTLTPEVFFSYALGKHALASRLAYQVRPVLADVGQATLGDVFLADLGAAVTLDAQRVDARKSVVLELAAGVLARGANLHEGRASLEARLAYRYRFLDNVVPYALLVGVNGGLVRRYGTPLVGFFLHLEAVTRDPNLDADGDGIVDRRDRCTSRVEDLDGFEDYDGCPEVDNDGDRILDEDDECPNDAEDPEAGLEGDGCPTIRPPDADDDGIPDAVDQCPLAPEDKDYFNDEDGCPEPDHDGDGLTDLTDLCPNAAEDQNGFQDHDGCPDGGKSARLVSFGKGRVLLYRPISFADDTANLLPESRKVLEQLAAVLRKYQRIERVVLTVYPPQGGRKGKQIAAARAEKLESAFIELGAWGRVHVVSSSWNERYAGGVVVTETVVTPAQR